MIDLDWLTDQLCDVLRYQLDGGDMEHADAPEVPIAGRRAWGIFLSLNAERAPGFSGPAPITSAAIEAWSRVGGERVRAWETEIVRALDAALIRAARDRQEGEGGGAPKPQVSSRPMSPALFDALFPIS